VVRRITDDVGDAEVTAEEISDSVEVLVTAIDEIGCDGLIACSMRSVGDAAGATGWIHDGAGERFNVEQPFVDPCMLDVEAVGILDPDVSTKRSSRLMHNEPPALKSIHLRWLVKSSARSGFSGAGNRLLPAPWTRR